MANITGFCLYPGSKTDFGWDIGEFNLTALIIDTDMLKTFQLSNIGNNLIDVIPGIKHHRIMGTKLYRLAQLIAIFNDSIHDLVFIVVNINRCPGRNNQQQDDAYGENDFENQAVAQIFNFL